MKAKDILKEIVKAYPDVVAIARDESNIVYGYFNFMPHQQDCDWHNFDKSLQINFEDFIEWDSEDWTKCIVTINDLQDEEL